MLKPLSILLLCFALSACSININKPRAKPVPPECVSSGIYLEKFELANGATLVVSEGKLEPRSLGSVTVKLFRDLAVGDFVAAVSFPRDGTILKAVLIENGSDKQKLSVTTVTAGSGNYQDSQLICVAGDNITLC
ncbi:PliI family lysozyme inhibitor of I-type lysozyme [Shewanella atlantica]|uniref:PliI family lysozyme inhibitor of I-type lysozyme n=1 Tax=Shewanella atlantica TaxID=271099 RepID=UPI003735851F